MSTGPDAPSPIVVALGGNAISPAGERDSIENQFVETRRSAAALAGLLATDAPVVLTHGNGPQVGAAVLRNELSAREVYEVPLDILVADLQGGMGFMIALCLMNELQQRGTPRQVATVITTVEVDGDDPAFTDPTKPIGPFYDPHHIAHLARLGWTMVEVPGRGLRRVVSSPRPRTILEIDLIRQLMHSGVVVIAAGGGGVPVVRDEHGRLTGREAVIDKDLASSLLARKLGAGLLIDITGVPRVCLNYGTSHERPIDRMTVSEARRHLEAGQFPRGSMGPKIEAAIEFLADATAPDARMLITDIEHIEPALRGESGTLIVPDDASGD